MNYGALEAGGTKMVVTIGDHGMIPEIAVAELGEDAGIIGAANL